MNIYNNLIPLNNSSAVALGFFDGIHLGHKAVIKAAVKQGNLNNLEPTVFTFKQQPSTVLKRKKSEQLITLEDKIGIMKDLKVKNLFYVDFNTIKNLYDYEFVEEVLHKKLKAKKVFCGYNFHFGKKGKADSNTLKELCKKYNIDVTVISQVKDDNKEISSTNIRKMLKKGDVTGANELLYKPFGFSSVVVKGNKIGRSRLKTPTINQNQPENLMLIKYGVYKSYIHLNGKKYDTITNFGVKPTVGSEKPVYETWIPKYNGKDLYGEVIDLRLTKFIRPEKKFDSLQKLQTAIYEDIKKADLDF